MKIKRENLLLIIILIVTVAVVAVWGNITKKESRPVLDTEVNSISESVSDTGINSESVSSVSTSVSKYESEKEESAVLINTESEKTEEAQVNEEMRGVWISYLSLSAQSEDAFKENYKNLLNKAEKENITDVFVHVRPFMDSMFESEYFPVSHLIEGEQGSVLSFDPLEFMIAEAHGKGMKFHAWINPLRIKTSSTPKVLSEENVYNKYSESDPYFFIETDNGIVLNPAYSFTRELVANGIREIVRNYKVDGIHFDDYFYPENYDIESDSAYILYTENADNPLSGNEWMQANINSLISLCYQAAKCESDKVVFGISPQGNMDNNLRIGADTKLWCAVKGYADYICPQLYWSYENPALGFGEAFDNWLSLPKHEEFKLYIGLALYKVGTESDAGTWEDGAAIIREQQKDALNKGAHGYVLYEISHFDKLCE